VIGNAVNADQVFENHVDVVGREYVRDLQRYRSWSRASNIQQEKPMRE
jgi:hypothetical protein